MDSTRIIYLHQQYLNGTITAEEWIEFKGILTHKDTEDLFSAFLDSNWDNIPAEEIENVEKSRFEKVYNYIISHQHPANEHADIYQDKSTFKVHKLWPRMAAAAAIILLIGAGIFFYGNQSVPDIKYANDIAPGKNTATLTLANGKKIILSDAVNGQLAEESGVRITKTAKGQIIYEIKDQQLSKADVLNTLSTARGETYQVRLPDGSVVYLNAESSLKYPASFAANKQRRVELTGEAYFEVAKDKLHPFIVATSKQTVEVLGTHFNINSYANEPGTKTTLLEGSVLITPQATGNAGSVLKPNQQAFLNGNAIQVKQVDARTAVDWKNNEIVFNGESLEIIMRKVSRWYNVEVVYENEGLKNQPFGGEVSRFANVSEVLDVLELTGFAHFDIRGRRIIVKE